jgi:hypothetical protein
MMEKREFFDRYEIVVKGYSHARVSLTARPAGIRYGRRWPITEAVCYHICDRDGDAIQTVHTDSHEVMLDAVMDIALKQDLYIANWKSIEKAYPWLDIPEEVKSKDTPDMKRPDEERS